jgi:coniferyl-aldehyde dehydrogenase
MVHAATLLAPTEFEVVHDLQLAAYKRNRCPSYEQRVADLRALHRMLVDNREALIDAVNKDYGCRASFETKFAELFLNQEGILETIKHLKKWMRPQKRTLDPTQYPFAKARVIPQPVGVVGVVVPWNFPISMAFAPLTGIFAAGNRAMVKMSENSDHLAQLLKEISPRYFPVDKLAFFDDGGGRGPAFTSLPFDHLFFTGSPATGRAVMANAARNLTPVTLELGGKSPAVIAPDYPIRKAAERILWAKMFNAGQICTNVDYLFVPEGKVDEFIAAAKQIAQARFPDIANGDYTALIDDRAWDRLAATEADAKAKGARVVRLIDTPDDPKRRLMPPRILTEVRDDMHVMQREIFGPLLPIKTYKTPEEVVDYVGDRPRPLAFYLYSNDKRLHDWYVANTISGGVTINDGLLHAGVHNLPFGGTGNSGMGHYHGYEGFTTFSKMRPVFVQGWRVLDYLVPPYQGLPNKVLNLMLKLKS